MINNINLDIVENVLNNAQIILQIMMILYVKKLKKINAF